MYPGGYFQYNKDPNDEIFAIKRYDRAEGKTEKVIGGPGGACRPQISPDGKKLAYVRRVRTKSVLFLHDMETGEDFPLFDGLQEAWTVFGSYTGFDWASDNVHVYIWGKGKIHKVNTQTKTAREVLFSVEVEHKLMKTVEFPNTAWEEDMQGGGRSNILSKKKGIYRTPSWSHDGKMIVYQKEGGNGHMGYSHSVKPGIYEMNAAGNGKSTLLVNGGARPVYSADGKKVFFTKGGFLFGSVSKSFEAYDRDKKTTDKIFNTKYTTDFTPSPDNKWVAFTELYKVYIAPMPNILPKN